MLQKGGREVKVRAHILLAAVLRTWNKWALGQQRGRPRGCPGAAGVQSLVQTTGCRVTFRWKLGPLSSISSVV